MLMILGQFCFLDASALDSKVEEVFLKCSLNQLSPTGGQSPNDADDAGLESMSGRQAQV